MYFRGKNVRIQADYLFSKTDGDLFTVRDMTEPEGELRFSSEAARELGVRAGRPVLFKFFGTPAQDDFVLELYDEDENLVDGLLVSDLRMTWQAALLLALTDISRDGGLVE